MSLATDVLLQCKVLSGYQGGGGASLHSTLLLSDQIGGGMVDDR